MHSLYPETIGCPQLCSCLVKCMYVYVAIFAHGAVASRPLSPLECSQSFRGLLSGSGHPR